MENMKKVLGFDWNKEEEWEKYLSELQEFYEHLVSYKEAMASLRKFIGSTLYDAISYDNELEILFVGGIGRPNGYQNFVQEVYGVGINEEDFEEALGTPRDRKNAEQIKTEIYKSIYIEEYKSHFAEAINEIENALSMAEFESAVSTKNFDYKGIVEKLLKKFVQLSPLTNPKTFFINSLAYTPKFYIERMYGDIDFIESYFKWKKYSSWKDADEYYNLWNFDDNSIWSKISETLDLMYGPKTYLYRKSFEYDIIPLSAHSPGGAITRCATKYVKVKDILDEYYKNKWVKLLKYPPIYAKIRDSLIYGEGLDGKGVKFTKYLDYRYDISLYKKFNLCAEYYHAGEKRWYCENITNRVGVEPFIKYIAPQLFVKTANIYPENSGNAKLVIIREMLD